MNVGKFTNYLKELTDVNAHSEAYLAVAKLVKSDSVDYFRGNTRKTSMTMEEWHTEYECLQALLREVEEKLGKSVTREIHDSL